MTSVAGTRDRPVPASLVVLAGSAVGAVLAVVLATPAVGERARVVVFSGFAAALVIVLLASWSWRLSTRVTIDDLRGICAPVLVLAAVAATVGAITEPVDAWLWLQFSLLLVVSAAAGALCAAEWSLRWLVGTGAVLVALLAVFVVRVGVESEREAVLATEIEEAVQETAYLAATAERAATQARTELDQAARTAAAQLGDVLPAASAEFRLHGERILTGLLDGARAGEEGALARLRSLPVSAERAQADATARDAAAAAVAAADAAANGASAPPPSEVDAAIADVCTRASDDGVDLPPVCSAAGMVPANDSAVGLAEALHRLDVALAYYRSAVDPDDESLSDAAAALAASDPPDLDRSVLDTAEAGATAILDSAGFGGPLRLVPGPLGWVGLGLLALWIVRQMLKLNALQMPGPVTVNYDGDHNEVLRVAVLRNLRSPGAAPGSEVVQSVTDLAALAGVQPNVIAKALAALGSVLFAPRGYLVDADLAPSRREGAGRGAAADDRPASGPTTVVVRVSAATSKESLATASFTDVSPQRAMRAAGLWAAGLLLSRSSRIPGWASWTAETAKALDATTDESPGLAELGRAARAAPTSGWILQLYGAELELAGRALDAIGVYARAAALHPRYLVARYRLAAALGMLGRDPDRWSTATLAQRSSIRDALADACDRLGIDPSLLQPLAGSASQDDFHRLAAELLRTIETDSTWARHRSALLRRSDRDERWLAWRGRSASRVDTLWLARSARLTYTGDDTRLEAEVEERAMRPSCRWQVPYNLACRHAAGSPGVALDWLETSLRRPGVEQLKSTWVRQDQDLGPLSAHPRFERFCRELEQGEAP